MSDFIWVDQTLSATLVMLCWWLSHENASRTLPFGLAMSLSYAALGMMLFGNVLVRAFYELADLLPLTLMLTKVAMITTFGIAVARRVMIERNKN